MPAGDARKPHFGPESDRLYMAEEGTLFSINLNGGDRRDHIHITAPLGTSFAEESPRAEDLRISPDGKYVLAHVIKQVWVVNLLKIGATVPKVDVRNPSLPVKRLTDIGADFVGWSDDSNSVNWAIGSSFYERPLASIVFREAIDNSNSTEEAAATEEDSEETFVPLDENEAVVLTPFKVIVERETTQGYLLLSGGNVITMAGTSTEEMGRVLENTDILIENNRINAIGPRGSLTLPQDVHVIDVPGKWIIPGFIDTHAHWEFRTSDVLEPSNWTVAINPAYGVTSGLDVQTAYHDYLCL
jgi:hypothetical protein